MVRPRRLRLRLSLAALAALAAPAAADVAVVKGGPAAATRPVVDGALSEAHQAMAVCWRAPTAGPVRIKLAVDRDGTVTATAATKGAAAQCAAGILAVWSLPGGPWKGEVDLAPGAAAAPALSQRIQRELASASASLRACQDRAPGKAGAVAIKLRINPDGSIAKDVKVTSSLGAALDGCVAQAVAAIRLAPLGTAAAVNYQLAIKFDGAAAGATSATSPGPAEAPTATVEGARAPAEIAAAVETARPALTRCLKPATGKLVVVRFTIRADGTTKNLVIKESSGQATADACVKQVLGGLKLATASDETKVVLPLRF